MQIEIDSSAAPRVVTVHVIVSDFHLSQGRKKKGPWHRMEDFRSDREFVAMLWHLVEKYGPQVKIKIRLNGDIFDFMATPYKGSYLAVSTVEAALEEFRTIADGHEEFFTGLREFLAANPNVEVVFTIGNHDQDLAWPELQEAVRDLIAPLDGRHRVRFVREERVGPVHVCHGDRFDKLNAVPPEEEMFITDKKGGGILPFAFLTVLLLHGAILSLWKDPSLLLSPGSVALGFLEFVALMSIVGWIWGKVYFSEKAQAFLQKRFPQLEEGKKFINYPLPYRMHAGLAMTLKRLFMPDMGRVQDHGAIWISTIARSPYWAPVMWVFLVSDILVHLFFIDVLSVRRKANLKIYWQVLASTMHADRIDEELERFAKENPEVKYVVAGHTHILGVKTINVADRVMMYLNSGTWVEQRDMVLPSVKTVTRAPRLEAFFRRIALHVRKVPFTALAIALVHACFGAMPFLVDTVFGWSLGVWAFVFPAVSLFLLLWRFSYTEYTGKPFRKLTGVRVEEFEDGGIQVAMCEYLPPLPGESGTGRIENAL